MVEHCLKTPVLFIIFNRPDTARVVFNEIKKVRPRQLFIAADGPRDDRLDDIELCERSRSIVKLIDWDCEVHTLFREKNLGCKAAVSSAIDWFFLNVEEGIILEDDCLPDQSFFSFCQNLLKYYRTNEKIMMISGTNILLDEVNLKESYYFSRYYQVWGWATWRRAWLLYDMSMSQWPEFKHNGRLKKVYHNARIRGYLEDAFQRTYDGLIDTWDYQWAFTCIFQDGYCILPKYNLVSNIGTTGTHFNKSNSHQLGLSVKSINVDELIHPVCIAPNVQLDTDMYKKYMNLTLWKNIKNIPRYLKRKVNSVKHLICGTL